MGLTQSDSLVPCGFLRTICQSPPWSPPADHTSYQRKLGTSRRLDKAERHVQVLIKPESSQNLNHLALVSLPAPRCWSHLQRSWSSSHGHISPSSPAETNGLSPRLRTSFRLDNTFTCVELTTGLSKICHMSGCSRDVLKLDDVTRRPNSSRLDTNMKMPCGHTAE